MSPTTAVLWGDPSYREVVTVGERTYVNYTDFGEFLLIKAAADGDSLAIKSLAMQYEPLLEKARTAQYRGLTQDLSYEDYMAAVYMAVYEAAKKYDPEYGDNIRFGGFVRTQLKFTLLDRHEPEDALIPTRTRTRYRKIVDLATEAVREQGEVQEGSDEFRALVIEEAHLLCPIHHMRVETFNAILMHDSAEVDLHEFEFELTAPIDISGDNQDMVRSVFRRSNPEDERLTNKERAVLKWRYGLGYMYDDLDDLIIDDPDDARSTQNNTDSAVAYYLGISRSAVQKSKQKALEKARIHLGV